LAWGPRCLNSALGSTVYAGSLDISKAFDTVNHHKMFETLLKTGFPV